VVRGGVEPPTFRFRFPVLDANIRLSDAGGERTEMVLTASYRPPLGAAGAGLDRLLLHRVATATIKTLLARPQ